jgi:hypothetical protein
MAKNLYLIGGGKGGTGKTLVSMATLDYLQSIGEDTILIETDTSNQEVWKSYNGEVASELVDMDEPEGWIRLVNLCNENPDTTVVVNTASRNNKGVGAYGEILNSTVGEIKRKLITLWVINRQRDSLELMKEFSEQITNAEIHVVMNGHYGEPRKFELYNGSNLKAMIEGRGGKSLLFPDLSDRVADDIYNGRLSIARAARELPIGNRADLIRWRNAARAMLSEVIK